MKITADQKKGDPQKAAAQLNGSIAKVATLPKTQLKTREAKEDQKGLT
ncbi:MAG: hypothetical protein ABSD92_05690 [Candidatus Bathyarchaeia archaeon]